MDLRCKNRIGTDATASAATPIALAGMKACATQAISPRAFQHLQGVFQRESGIHLSHAKQNLVATRLQHRLQRLGLPDFDAYCALIAQADTGDERRLMVDLLTTNETYFFREPAHFDHLISVVLPTIERRPLRIWSAASSSGEEPFSIAMSLAAALGEQGWEVLGTDLSARVLAQAARGVYRMERLQHLPETLLKRYCLRGKDEFQGAMLIARSLRDKVRFGRHNLLDSPQSLGRFDVVFMRNVLIYFDRTVRQRIVSQALQALRPGGWFYTGHAESLQGLNLPLDLVRPSIYRKRERP